MATQAQTYNLNLLKRAVKSGSLAVLTAELTPPEGEGGFVTPTTYTGGQAHTGVRWVGNEKVPTVTLASPAAYANKIEEALLRAGCPLPTIAVDFGEAGIPGLGLLRDIQLPHRGFDATLRESHPKDRPSEWFRPQLKAAGKRNEKEVYTGTSDLGRRLEQATLGNATDLFENTPATLVFGGWNSNTETAVAGAKFERLLTGRIIGLYAEIGTRVGSRLDPLQVRKVPIYEAADGTWTSDPAQAVEEKGKGKKLFKRSDSGDGKPTEIGLSNTPPGVVENQQKQPIAGWTSIRYAEHVAVFSFTALRNLFFPPKEKAAAYQPDGPRDDAARVVLAALAFLGVALQREQGYHLRSGCDLLPRDPAKAPTWGFHRPVGAADQVEMSAAVARTVLDAAVEEAKGQSLEWRTEPLLLNPSKRLQELVRVSRFKSDAES